MNAYGLVASNHVSSALERLLRKGGKKSRATHINCVHNQTKPCVWGSQCLNEMLIGKNARASSDLSRMFYTFSAGAVPMHVGLT